MNSHAPEPELSNATPARFRRWFPAVWLPVALAVLTHLAYIAAIRELPNSQLRDNTLDTLYWAAMVVFLPGVAGWRAARRGAPSWGAAVTGAAVPAFTFAIVFTAMSLFGPYGQLSSSSSALGLVLAFSLFAVMGAPFGVLSGQLARRRRIRHAT